MSVARYDAVVVGGGHNGLVCAAYLARAGRSVLVLEANPHVGGAAVTREFAPGFRVSAGAHLLHLMPKRLIAELNLSRHGLSMAATHMPTYALASGVGTVRIEAAARSASDGLTAADAQALPEFFGRMHTLAAALWPLLEGIPPRLGAGEWRDRLTMARLGIKLRLLGRRRLRELLRIAGMCVHDLLEEHFHSPLLKGALAFDAVLGTNYGPRSPGTVFTLLYRMAAEGAAGQGLAQPAGGLGALSEALESAASAAGAEIRTATPVQRILVDGERACGVRLESGEQVEAKCVISGADPRTTYLKLLGAEQLDAGFVRRITHLRTHGMTAKFHAALERMPTFLGIDGIPRGRVVLAPSPDAIERAFNHAKYGEFSASPVLEVVVPTSCDAALAPAGKHVLSAIVQYAPYQLREGWDSGRARFTDLILETLERHAPGLRAAVSATELLTPADIEAQFRISGGHWHHAELALDQFFTMRPVIGAAQYRAPVPGLYLCGAGTHPGGGVLGMGGRNAAQQVLREAR